MNPLCSCINTGHQCPSSALANASSMTTKTPLPTSPSHESPIVHGHPSRHLSRMVCPTQPLSRLKHGCSVLAWTHTWSGSIEGQSHEFSISGETVSYASGHTSTITGCLSTLTVSELHEFGATILEQLVQSAALSSEAVDFEEFKWIWEWA